jgi:zinc protease
MFIRIMKSLVWVWAGCGLALAAYSAAPNTHEFKLDNGMKIIVREDHRAPVVVSQVWYRIGSIDEVNGTTGVAHVLEHMMFKGTKEVPAGQFSRVVAMNGGRDNAFTNRDYTTYFEQLSNDKLELALKLEADRMQNLGFSDEEFWKEIKVVMEERRLRVDDKAHSRVHEQMMATAFTAHPYGRPIIGWMNDLENMKPDDARAWYKRWYAPNNATLVVIGDVDPQKVFELAKKYFDPLQMSLLPERKPQLEPEQRGIKRIVVKAPAHLPYLAMGFHAPVLRDVEKDWEPFALQVLVGVLDGNESARLNKNLVRTGNVANHAGAGYDGLERGPGMFVLDGTPSEGKTVADLEAALRAEVDKIKTAGITDEELERVKSQVIAARVFGLDSMFGQAMQIGNIEITGFSWRDFDRLMEKLKQVSADQVKEVANKYLQDDQLTVAVLDPQPLDAQPRRPAVEGVRHTQ